VPGDGGAPPKGPPRIDPGGAPAGPPEGGPAGAPPVAGAGAGVFPDDGSEDGSDFPRKAAEEGSDEAFGEASGDADDAFGDGRGEGPRDEAEDGPDSDPPDDCPDDPLEDPLDDPLDAFGPPAAGGPAPGLHLLPGPLGNLGDLSPRAAAALAAADLVAAEDTRRSVKLLNHLGLKKRLASYRGQNHDRAWPAIRQVLAGGGRVALLSDAGAPTVSDPGAKLVAEARAAGFGVWPVPGPSAVITALMACGMPSTPFTFAGFLPPRRAARRTAIEALKGLPGLLVLFESPVRLAASLADLAGILGPRPAFMAREMTKIHEEYLSLDLPALAAEIAARPRKGEVTLVIGPGPALPAAGPPDPAALEAAIAGDPRPTRVVAESLAAEFGLPRKRMYDLVVSVRNRLKDPDGR
jgi:16S rRNA (cytidine1402-2'-O)-methyltransferase